MNPAPVVVFDVNETLSDLSGLAPRFAEMGAEEWAAKVWFASLLRDGFALTAAGSTAPFGTVAEGALRSVLAGTDLACDIDTAIERVLSGFAALPLHPDVTEAIVALSGHGIRLVTLTNGSTAVAPRLLSEAGIRDRFEQLLSVEAAGVWKPAAGGYLYAARACGVPAGRLLLVAVHPWDIHGAARAGLHTAWLNRSGDTYPGYFARPDHTIAALTDLAARLREP
jgi:2-haloacid dehalogenase